MGIPPTWVRRVPKRGSIRGMLALKAHVENGRVVVDEPVNLPDGTELRVLIDQTGVMPSGTEREELARALEAFEPGDFENAEAFAARLAAKP